MIQTSKLHKYYNKGRENEIHVINDTSITLPETGLVCILGESGSGKTTLLNTLGGLDDFATGELSIAEETMSQYSQEKMDVIRTKYCGYVFQNYYLLPEHTVDYNIRLVLNMYDMTEEEKTKRIDYVLEAVDMQKYKKRQVSQLSGGQQQRVAIARALAKTPKVIFADEPTGNLDEANTLRVMQILKQVSKKCLVVMVTHEVRLADIFADRIIRVESGRVISDSSSQQSGEYQYEDDSTIYLKEYTCNEYVNGEIVLNNYTAPISSAVVKQPLMIRVIEAEGRYYIQAVSDANVILLQPNSKKKVVDEERPIISEDNTTDFSFELEQLECKRMPELSLKEIILVAIKNLKLLGKQQMFMAISFVVMAILLVVAVSDILTLNSIDVRSVVQTDDRYLEVKVEKNGGFDTRTYNEYFSEMYDQFLEETDASEVFFNFDTDFYFIYQGFEQMEDIKALITGYSVAPISNVTENQLIAGRMPQTPYEIVIDTWVLENFIEKEVSIAQIHPNVEDYLGKELSVDRKSWGLKIVGISDSNQPNIYMDKYTMLFITARITNPMIGEEMLKSLYPNEFQNLSLAEDEVLISESYKEKLESVHSSTEFVSVVGVNSYKVVGTFPGEVDVPFVVSEKNYDNIIKYLVTESKSFIVSTDDKQSVKDYFKSLPEEDTKNLQIFVTDPYLEEIKLYEEARAIKLDARLIITITIFVISIVLLYFSMKSNAMKKLDEIMVYRLIGIKKRSILMIFAVESALLTCYTSVPAVLIASLVLKFIVSIPSLELSMVYPWGAAVGIIVFLLVINTVTGILPIIRLVRKPPAQLSV